MDRKKTEIINSVKKFISIAKQKTEIEKVIMFGSQARGEPTENSDVDIIIISKDFENKKSYKRASPFYFMWNLPYDGDIICLTPEEFNIKKKQIGIIKTAAEEGIEI